MPPRSGRRWNAHLETYPTHLSFLGGNHVRIEWLSYGHVYSRTEASYSPGEGAVRSIKHPRTVLPLRKFSDGSGERVWLGFETPVCIDPEALAGRAHCQKYGPEVLLITDMTCQREGGR